MSADAALRLLGLARRAGALAVGTEAVRQAGRGSGLALLVVAEDASSNALDRIHGASRGTPMLRLGTRTELGSALGRGAVAVVGVIDNGLARGIENAARAERDCEEEV